MILIDSDISKVENNSQTTTKGVRAHCLEIKMAKIKFMSPEETEIIIETHRLETVDVRINLGRNAKIDKDNQAAKILQRVGLSWAAFGNLKHVLRNTI